MRIEPENSMIDQVKEFYDTFGVSTPEHPTIATMDRFQLRLSVMNEELQEFIDAARESDIVGIADALGDLIYVVIGTALEYGIPLEAIVTEIHQSNMTKLDEDGKPIFRNDGKILKGPNYMPPDIKRVLTLSTIRLMGEVSINSGCPTCGKTGPDSINLDYDSGQLEAVCGNEWHDHSYVQVPLRKIGPESGG